jgi:hypothetical protein
MRRADAGESRMLEQLTPQEIRPTIHELSLLKQIIESRSRSLEVVREALSNMCAPEVAASNVYIKCFTHPDHGVSFVFEDDGCGMTLTGDREKPGRLDRFLNIGFGGAAGLKGDRYSWKGLGSKLMLNCRRLELETWTGQPSDPVCAVQVISPAEKLLRDVPEWPKFYVVPRKAESGDHQGTRITIFGYEGGKREYSFDELRYYLYWNTIVGMTHKLDSFPHAFLKVGAHEEEIEVGYRWILPPENGVEDSWKTVLVDPPIKVTELSRTGEPVTVTLKGGFTLNTANACGPGISLSKFRYNTGLRLSVLGIPFFRLEFGKLKGERFQQYQDLCSFVIECDALSTRLNIDRSGYNQDDPIAEAFERATKKAFDQFAQTDKYKSFQDKKRREDEKTKGKLLNLRKSELNSPEQEYICIDGGEKERVLHRKPENEHDTLALFWKLEATRSVPFAQFISLEHTAQSGIDVIATFQESEDSQLRIMEAVEFEHVFENFHSHGHNPKQTSLVICWTIRDPSKVQKINDYEYRADLNGQVVNVLEMSKFPAVRVRKRSEIDW